MILQIIQIRFGGSYEHRRSKGSEKRVSLLPAEGCVFFHPPGEDHRLHRAKRRREDHDDQIHPEPRSTGTVSWYPRKKIKDIVDIVRVFYETWDDEAYRRYLALFGLDENKTPLELSEGMKVKFNLLIALSHGAEILILDEPTSGLDPFSRDELLDVFTELKEHGVAVFFSTHITSDLEKCADDIVYISNGAIVAAMPKLDFTAEYSQEGESLEETILRMERGMLHA